MIGTHSVVAYTDRNAAGWGAPLFTNSYFDNDLTGWRATPFGHPWTWSGGAATFANYVGTATAGAVLIRTDAATVDRPAARAYRIRAAVYVSRPATVWLSVLFGTTRRGAAQGPFWFPAEAREQSKGVNVQSGTTTIELTFAQTAPPGPEYVYLGVQARIAPSPNDLVTPLSGAVSSLEVHFQSTGTSADLSCLVDEVSIVHGRDSASGQPSASAATLDFTVTPEEPLPALVDIGAVVVITTTTPTGSSTRFTGRVTDLALSWDDAGEETPRAGVGQIVAVSMLADLARRVVGAEPFPQELDGARIARIADGAGEPLDPRWSDPGTVQILPRDIDSQPALDVMTDVADSAGGMMWNTRAGELRYADAEHRRGIAPSLLVDACDLLVTPEWLRNLEGLVNEVSIGYGVAPEGGEQPRYLASDAASIARYGRYEYTFTSELAALADAQAMGQLTLVRNSSPVWILSVLPVDLAGLDSDRTVQALTLEMHSLLQVTGLPIIGSAPTTASLWVEGWRERLAYGVHELELNVSGYCRTSPPPRWNDLSPELTWDTVTPPSLTWNDTTCLGPTPPRDIWDAQPASLRWDDVPPGMSWDSFTPLTMGG